MKAATISADIQTVGFIAREAPFGHCTGCLFDHQSSTVCLKACSAAVAAGQPDCDDRAPNRNGYIYVLADPRQLVLPTGEGDANAA